VKHKVVILLVMKTYAVMEVHLHFF